MSIEVTPELVSHVARLSRLALSEAELAEMRGHFEKILRFVESLESLDTSDVDPSIFALDTHTVLRPDAARPSLPVEAALANAPRQADGFFLVPRILAEA